MEEEKPASRQNSFLYATHYDIPSKLKSLDETENIVDKLPDVSSPAFLEEGIHQRQVQFAEKSEHENSKDEMKDEITIKPIERRSSFTDVVDAIKTHSSHCCSLDPLCGFWCCCNSSEPHTIDVRVKDIHQLFNTLDPSPVFFFYYLNI